MHLKISKENYRKSLDLLYLKSSKVLSMCTVTKIYISTLQFMMRANVNRLYVLNYIWAKTLLCFWGRVTSEDQNPVSYLFVEYVRIQQAVGIHLKRKNKYMDMARVCPLQLLM